MILLKLILQSHTFSYNGTQMVLDGKPFVMIAGEMHPSRIPYQYWRHRIQMTKAMGCNAIQIYVFWNVHEQKEGQFDFQTPQSNISNFLQICQEEDILVVVRPGPYVCAETDFGGIPPYLLRDPKLRIRTLGDENYKNAAETYIKNVAHEITPHMHYNGGNVIIVQIENEYGHWPQKRQEKAYIEWIQNFFISQGITGPFCTADSPYSYNANVRAIGDAIGLDGSKLQENDWELATRLDPKVPVYNSEMYTGWLRHWGERNWEPENRSNEFISHLNKNRSFSFYVVHGGTNFGRLAGANGDGLNYQPALTSYDYGAPINESGHATPLYNTYRDIIHQMLGKNLPDVPAPIPTIQTPIIKMKKVGTMWGQYFRLDASNDGPKWFETYEQNQGYILYQMHIEENQGGLLKFEHIADYAQLYLSGELLGVVDARTTQKFEFEIPVSSSSRFLDILVEATGHKNYGISMEDDRKGVFGAVTINGTPAHPYWTMKRLDFDVFPKTLVPNVFHDDRLGGIYAADFELDKLGDTFIDFLKYEKGTVWVNDHLIGRYWNVGPQKCLYVPGTFLLQGKNRIVVIENVLRTALNIQGCNACGWCSE